MVGAVKSFQKHASLCFPQTPTCGCVWDTDPVGSPEGLPGACIKASLDSCLGVPRTMTRSHLMLLSPFKPVFMQVTCDHSESSHDGLMKEVLLFTSNFGKGKFRRLLIVLRSNLDLLVIWPPHLKTQSYYTRPTLKHFKFLKEKITLYSFLMMKMNDCDSLSYWKCRHPNRI